MFGAVVRFSNLVQSGESRFKTPCISTSWFENHFKIKAELQFIWNVAIRLSHRGLCALALICVRFWHSIMLKRQRSTIAEVSFVQNWCVYLLVKYCPQAARSAATMKPLWPSSWDPDGCRCVGSAETKRKQNVKQTGKHVGCVRNHPLTTI